MVALNRGCISKSLLKHPKASRAVWYMRGKLVNADVNTALLISHVKVSRRSGAGDYAGFVGNPCSISAETDATAESYDTFGCGH